MLAWVLVCGRALAVGRIEWPLRTARVTEHVHAAHCLRLVPYPKPLPTVFQNGGPPNGGRGSRPWSSFGQRGETYAPSAVGKKRRRHPPPFTPHWGHALQGRQRKSKNKDGGTNSGKKSGVLKSEQTLKRGKKPWTPSH